MAPTWLTPKEFIALKQPNMKPKTLMDNLKRGYFTGPDGTKYAALYGRLWYIHPDAMNLRQGITEESQILQDVA